jgi:hypothetical protein
VVYDAASVVLVFGDAVRATVGLLVGVGIVATGLRYTAGGHSGHGGGINHPFVGRLAGLFGSLQTRLDGLASGPGIVGLGLVHGLLPCPLLYPAYLFSKRESHPSGRA